MSPSKARAQNAVANATTKPLVQVSRLNSFADPGALVRRRQPVLQISLTLEIE